MKKLSKNKPMEEMNTVDLNDNMFDTTTNSFNKYDSFSYNNLDLSPPLPTSLEDIKSEIDSIQMRLSIPPPTSETTTPRVATKKSTQKYVSSKRIYVPAHIQAIRWKQPMTEPKDLKIQTKLTRIAKFPLSHFHNVKINPVLESPQIVNENSNLQKRTVNEKRPKIKVKKSLGAYVTVTPKYAPSSAYNDFGKSERYKPYPDYFNDLLMWHGDLLNTDKVTSPQWENILKDIKQDTEFSTLSMTDMQKELMNIKEFLKMDEVSSKPIVTAIAKFKEKPQTKAKKDKTRNAKRKQDYIRTVAVKDNTMAQTNDIIIQGEAKYYHFIKQPERNPEKYIQAADLINNLNKIYFKGPNKQHAEEKPRDNKRNGELWKNDNGNVKIFFCFLVILPCVCPWVY